jgi:hypothetical protein
MSVLEASVIPLVGSMILDNSTMLPLDAQRQIAVWATKTAMVIEGTISNPKRRLYTRTECEQLRAHAIIPDRTLIWIARISSGGLFANGTHIWLRKEIGERSDGQVGTFVVGNFISKSPLFTSGLKLTRSSGLTGLGTTPCFASTPVARFLAGLPRCRLFPRVAVHHFLLRWLTDGRLGDAERGLPVNPPRLI